MKFIKNLCTLVISMLNLYTPEIEHEKPIKNDYTYFYLGGVMVVSFLLGPYVLAGSGIGSFGYLYYENYYKKSIKSPKSKVELTSIYICKNV